MAFLGNTEKDTHPPEFDVVLTLVPKDLYFSYDFGRLNQVERGH